MMSWPCGRICAGKYGGLAAEPSQPVTFMTEIDESIQVSRTSVSPSNSVEPQRGHGPNGLSTVGSMGRSASSGRSISPQAVQNQTGIGVAKIRWREMHQSHSIFPTQSSIRRSMCSGTQRTFRAASRIAPGSTFTNHCRSERISIGVLHRQQAPTRCSSGTCRFRTPASSIATRTASRHSGAVIPSYGPASAVMWPAASSAGRSSSPWVFHQTTSCLSPKVQIITAPEPKAGSTASSRTTGTAWPKSGTVSGPASAAYRSSAGCTATATQAARSSGRVVAISRPSKSKKFSFVVRPSYATSANAIAVSQRVQKLTGCSER